jgi:hypothetical protein
MRRMKTKKLKLCAILFLGLALNQLYAQEAITASGGNASGSGGSAGYTVGQVAYTTNTGTKGSVAQGVQQPFEISVVTAIEEAKEISLNFMAYPNPATDYLILKVEGELQASCIASLYDINGKLIQNFKVESNETRIAMESFLPATYFLKVVKTNQASSKSQEIITFKIIKTN